MWQAVWLLLVKNARTTVVCRSGPSGLSAAINVMELARGLGATLDPIVTLTQQLMRSLNSRNTAIQHVSVRWPTRTHPNRLSFIR